ncbi:MAG: preprotein translocase subunit SecG [Alphaproteobacteria bacterium]
MITVVFVIHIVLALALVATILLQRSEGGALGIGGGMGGFVTGRSAGNALTRATAVFAGLFLLTSIALVVLPNLAREGGSIMSQPHAPAAESEQAPGTTGALPGGDGVPAPPAAPQR